MNDAQDPLVYATPIPPITDLVDLFKECSPFSVDGFDRLNDADNVRYTRWANQSPDGKKRSTRETKAEPWEGASDTRVSLADDIIDETSAVKELAFWRSILRPQPVEIGDIDQSGAQARLLDWIVNNRLLQQLANEVPLSAQYWDAYGWTVLKVTWEQEVKLRYRRVTIGDLIAGASTVQDGPIANLPTMIQVPAMDSESAKILTQAYDQFVAATLGNSLAGDVPKVAQKVIHKAIQDLRSTGAAEFPMPYLSRNDPSVVALKPWEDVFLPPHTTDIQKAQVVFHREFLSEADLRARILSHGYAEAWVEEAVKTKGKISAWHMDQAQAVIEQQFQTLNREHCLIEVVHAYQRLIDENNVLGIWCTTFSPHVTGDAQGRPLAAKHEFVDYGHGLMPFVAGKREHATRRVCDSRGIPELVWCAQREEKVQRDSIVDNTSFATLPPILVPMGRPVIPAQTGARGAGMATQYKFGPAYEVPYRVGAKPEFMERPPLPVVAFQLIELLERKVAHRFGRLQGDVPPTLSQMKQQRDVNGFLTMWRLAFKQMFALCQQYVGAEEYRRITGSDPQPIGPTELERQYDMLLAFDVRELDTDHVKAKLEAITKVVLPVDIGGTIDRTKLVKLLMRAIDPAAVKELLTDETAASRAIYDRVQNDIALMALGNELPYTDQVDPTSSRQLQYAQAIIFGDQMGGGGNPQYQQLLQSGGRFKELFENWVKNRQHSVQQIQNQTIGRTGVENVG